MRSSARRPTWSMVTPQTRFLRHCLFRVGGPECLFPLVSCPRNNIYFAGSQLAVFQGANERPYLNHTGRESNAEKRPTGSGPEGCDENGPATALGAAPIGRSGLALAGPKFC